jgi:hypothetical protein
VALCPRLSTLRLDAQILSSAVSAAAKCLGRVRLGRCFFPVEICGKCWKNAGKWWDNHWKSGEDMMKTDGKIVKTS